MNARGWIIRKSHWPLAMEKFLMMERKLKRSQVLVFFRRAVLKVLSR